MLTITRVVGTMDVSRLGEAMARPGMDTRQWVSLAVVASDPVADEQHGFLVDVVTMPEQRHATARVGQEYAGSGWGLHMPLYKDDEVLVEAPSGDPSAGLVVTRRLHSPSDPPSDEAIQHPRDVVLVVKPGQSVHLVVSDDGKVNLGGADASRGVARQDDSIVISGTNLTALQTHLDARYIIQPGTPPPLSPINGAISSSSDVVRST